MSHVVTQAPYVIVVVLVSILLGTVPIGYDAWPNIIGILLGAMLIVCFVYFVCVPVISPSGRFDMLTELVLMLMNRRKSDSDEVSPLAQLKEDTKTAYMEGDVVVKPEEIDENMMEVVKESNYGVDATEQQDHSEEGNEKTAPDRQMSESSA